MTENRGEAIISFVLRLKYSCASSGDSLNFVLIKSLKSSTFLSSYLCPFTFSKSFQFYIDFINHSHLTKLRLFDQRPKMLPEITLDKI